MRRHCLFPPPAADAGLDVAQMSDSETVCGCMGVTKGAIIHAIHEKGVNTLAQLKECTRASTGCGSCTSLCQSAAESGCAGVPGRGQERRSASACRSPRTICARSCAASS